MKKTIISIILLGTLSMHGMEPNDAKLVLAVEQYNTAEKLLKNLKTLFTYVVIK